MRAVYIALATLWFYSHAPAKAAESASASPQCPGSLSEAPPTLQAEYPAFKRRVETSPFYRALVKRLGSPTSCTRGVEAGALRLTYVFPRRGGLEARIDPRLELSDHRLTLPGLPDKDARALLQAAEKSAFGPDGCGIEWEKPPVREDAESGNRELVYWGDVCNCQGRLGYRDGGAMQLVFRSAC